MSATIASLMPYVDQRIGPGRALVLLNGYEVEAFKKFILEEVLCDTIHVGAARTIFFFSNKAPEVRIQKMLDLYNSWPWTKEDDV